MGKKKYIETPEKMWSIFCDYRKFVKENPIQKTEQSKMPQRLSDKMALGLKPSMVKAFLKQTLHLPLEKPLTIEGFENYCADEGILEDLKDYFSNKDDRYKDYAPICTRIKNVIRQDQIEGGMAGIYNPSITQRLNNLVDKTQMQASIIITPMSKDEEDELRKAATN